jgi:hypothetical protein
MGIRIPEWIWADIRRRWEIFYGKAENLRQWLNINPKVAIGITIASASVLLIVVICMLIPPKTPEIEVYEKQWYYDLNTAKLFTAKADLAVPIEAPSGPLKDGTPAGVRAYVFSYVQDPNESERFIGFLETTDPNVTEEELAAAKTMSGAVRWGRGKLIKTVEDENWYRADSRAGLEIVKQLSNLNDKGQEIIYCPPK